MIDYDECRECFVRALTRISVTLNAHVVEELVAALSMDDDALRRQATASSFARDLFRLSTESPLNRELAYSDYANFFYGITRLEAPEPSRGIRRVVHHATPVFIEALRRGHQRPDYNLDDMGFTESTSPLVFDRTIATNYIVKNLWHNVVHLCLQGISESNFRDFRGTARESSDFAADTLAVPLMALSYGRNVRVASLSDPADCDDNIVYLLRRNRSNRIFALRSAAIGETAEDLDWRYRRMIAVYLAGWLMASGRTAATLSVQFGRDIPNIASRIVVEVNGHYFSTDVTRVRLPTVASSTDERDRFRSHVRQIAIFVDLAYRRVLANDPRRQVLAQELLHHSLSCVGATPNVLRA